MIHRAGVTATDRVLVTGGLRWRRVGGGPIVELDMRTFYLRDDAFDLRALRFLSFARVRLAK